MNRSAVLYALLSAALFGAATPATKVLLGSVAPFLAAGLLYCGAGIGAALLRSAGRLLPGGRTEAEKVRLTRTELPWLGGAIAAGGIVGPALLMIGLARTEASTSSLLLTLEGAATAVLAWFVFGENFDRRIALGMVLLVLGAGVLTWSGLPSVHDIVGPLAIIGACMWTSLTPERIMPSRLALNSHRNPIDPMVETRKDGVRGVRVYVGVDYGFYLRNHLYFSMIARNVGGTDGIYTHNDHCDDWIVALNLGRKILEFGRLQQCPLGRLVAGGICRRTAAHSREGRQSGNQHSPDSRCL